MMKKVRAFLIENQEEKYRLFQERGCPGSTNVLGVRIPLLRKFAKSLSLEEAKSILKEEPFYYEESILQTILFAKKGWTKEETTAYLDLYVPRINTWQECDMLYCGLKIVKQEQDYFWNYLQKFKNSLHEFEVRFFVVMNFYYLQTNLERTFAALAEVHHSAYYVKMAIAWVLSMAYVVDSKMTLQALATIVWDPFIYQKAIQKMIESYQISPTEKDYLRTLKRRAYDPKY